MAASLSLLALPKGGEAAEPPSRADGRRLWRLAAVPGALAACVLIIELGGAVVGVLLLEEHRGATPLVSSAAPVVYMAALAAGRIVMQALPGVPLRVMYLVAGGGAGIALAALGGNVPISMVGFAVTGLSGWLGLPAALAALGLLGVPLVGRFAFERS